MLEVGVEGGVQRNAKPKEKLLCTQMENWLQTIRAEWLTSCNSSHAWSGYFLSSATLAHDR